MVFLGVYRKMSRQLASGTCLLFVSFQAGFSQAPETVVQALSRHGVAVTKPALVDALRNSDKEVRGLAAAELAELKATDTLPEIMRAAEIEQDTPTKVNIATAATWLGSPDGLNTLKRVCRDSTLPPIRATKRRA